MSVITVTKDNFEEVVLKARQHPGRRFPLFGGNPLLLPPIHCERGWYTWLHGKN